ncbi:hypothetical protein D8767_22985 [Pseudomonas sp. LTGT-11-2Z]|uniref:Uncharacterized protein n=1 Tax=Pseudomonas monteilii TaxID=76759 RepID=A0A399M1V9_9PSED|nr:hypothetical protein D8767_22985 [Pseudomonas sp. LTGT-11-2Z]RII75744.1 hypothetical protein D0894_20085 [Pseudomonas monteilii]
MVQPCFEIDTAVGVDRLVHSHLYHLCFTFPYSAPRGCAGDHRAAAIPWKPHQGASLLARFE